MKLSRMSVICAALAVAMASTAMAQGPHRRGGDLFGPMMADVLDLTSAQQTQIKQIFESGKSTMAPLWQQEHQDHQAMLQLITSGSFDATKAQTIANDEAQAQAQMAVERAKLAAQAYQVLTADQKTKLNDLLAKREQRMEQRIQQHSQTATQQ